MSSSPIVWLATTLICWRLFHSQRAQAGVDVVGDIEQAGCPLDDDDAGRRELPEPRGVRTARCTPVWASIDANRADTACWVNPISRAAAPRLPSLAIAIKTSNEASSGMRELSNMIDRNHQNRPCAVMKLACRNEPVSSAGSGQRSAGVGRRDDRRRAERMLASHVFGVHNALW